MPFGIARVTDPVFCEADVHGFPPFTMALPVLGRLGEGSVDTLCNDRQAARMGDTGSHRGCPSTNTFMVSSGSQKTYVNDRPRAREGDHTIHCGGFIENPGSSVGAIMDGLGSPNTFCEANP